MTTSNYITDFDQFEHLWTKARAGLQALPDAIQEGAALYFDSCDVSTLKYFRFIRALLEFNALDTFAVLVLRPDPVTYFHRLFGKYPAIILRPEHCETDFLASLHADPGGNLVDAIATNSERYAVFPIGGEWIIYADRFQEVAVMSAKPDVLTFTREHYPFNVFESNPGFSLIDLDSRLPPRSVQ